MEDKAGHEVTRFRKVMWFVIERIAKYLYTMTMLHYNIYSPKIHHRNAKVTAPIGYAKHPMSPKLLLILIAAKRSSPL